jgi:hypothetical protein
MTAIYASLHFLWIALFACGKINYGFVAFAWTVFFINACILISVRLEVRTKLVHVSTRLASDGEAVV